jgi:radical SAM protein with 4Fe4S-binding SPASM domain
VISAKRWHARLKPKSVSVKIRIAGNSSEVFISLRNYDKLKGKHGKCEYRKICGGCRARAFEAAEDYLAEEPLCLYKLKPIP